MAMKFKPKFAGRGVQIDGPPVDSPDGKGLLNKSPQADTTVPSQSDKDMVNHGLLSDLGDDLTETDAMSDVDDNGVDSNPQGVKTPGHTKPTDGFTKKVSHNHQNSIAEDIAAMMDGGSDPSNMPPAPGNELEQREAYGVGEGALTMEELFESYLEECGEDVSHDDFAAYSGEAGYESPEPSDTESLMGDHQGYMFTPVGNGLYKKEAVSQEVGVEDLPGRGPAPVVPAGPVVDGHNTPGSPHDIAQSMPGDPYDAVPTEGSEGDNNHHPEAGDFPGKEKRLDHKGGGSSGRGFKEGPPKPTVDYNDGEGMEVSYGGGSVTEDSVTTSQLAVVPTTTPDIKKGKVKKAGNAATAVKGMENHGDPTKRKIKNDDKLEEGVRLPQAVAANVARIVEHVNAHTKKFPVKSDTINYRAVVELNGKSGYTARTNILAEAAVDAEELAVIGRGKVLLEVTLMEGTEQNGVFRIKMPRLARRKPTMVAEGMLFRFPSIARRYAATIIGESVVHTVAPHAFGAIIKGDVEELAKLRSAK